MLRPYHALRGAAPVSWDVRKFYTVHSKTNWELLVPGHRTRCCSLLTSQPARTDARHRLWTKRDRRHVRDTVRVSMAAQT
eukprot:8273936-Pyramimonas_sp.AAC.1